MDFNELEAVMERFLWQSYAQHLQNTLFHNERIEPLRKKSLQDRLDQAYDFKKRGDERVDNSKFREAQTQYEFAYGLFKYCDKTGRKITMHDDTKAARELREEQANSREGIKDDAFTRFWLEVDEMMCSCLVMMALCKSSYKNPLLEEALQAANEALEFCPTHAPALYRRSQVHELLEMYGEAVADARAAYRHAPEELKFDLWRHRKHAIATRRANTVWWGFVGAVGDLPGNVVRFPLTFARMSPRRQALLVLCVSLAVGLYRMPPGLAYETYRGLVGAMPNTSWFGNEPAESEGAGEEPEPSAAAVGVAVAEEATKELAAAAAKAGAAIAALGDKPPKANFWKGALRAIGIGREKKSRGTAAAAGEVHASGSAVADASAADEAAEDAEGE